MAPHAPRFSVEPSCTRPFANSAPGGDTRRLCPRVARGRVYSEPGGGTSRPLAPPGPAAEHDRRRTVTAKHLRRWVRNLWKGSGRAGRARSWARRGPGTQERRRRPGPGGGTRATRGRSPRGDPPPSVTRGGHARDQRGTYLPAPPNGPPSPRSCRAAAGPTLQTTAAPSEPPVVLRGGATAPGAAATPVRGLFPKDARGVVIAAASAEAQWFDVQTAVLKRSCCNCFAH